MRVLTSVFCAMAFPIVLGAQVPQFEVIHQLDGGPSFPALGVVKTPSGSIYSLSGGGIANAGCLSVYTSVDETFNKVADFADINARINVFGTLGHLPTGFAVDSGGAIYGWAMGGTERKGILWRWSDGAGLEEIYDFGSGILASPINNVISDGNAIYGSCSKGGGNGAGALWKWTQATGLEIIRSHQGTFTFVPKGITFVNGKIWGVSQESFSGVSSAHVWEISLDGVYVRKNVSALDGKSVTGLVVACDGGVFWGAKSGIAGPYDLRTYYLYQTQSGGATSLRHELGSQSGLSGQSGHLIGGVECAAGVFAGSSPATHTLWKYTNVAGFEVEEVTGEVGAPLGQLIFEDDGVSGMHGGGYYKINFDGASSLRGVFPNSMGTPWLTGLAIAPDGAVFTSSFFGDKIQRWNRLRPNVPELLALNPTEGICAGEAFIDASGGYVSMALDPAAIFRVSPQGVAKEVAALRSINEGQSGYVFVRDKAGNLYGTTYVEGADFSERTKLWRCTPSGKLSVVAHLNPSTHGTGFTYSLYGSPDGSIYGSTSSGGAEGFGALWKWSATKGLSVVKAFEDEESLIDGGLERLPDSTLVGFEYFGRKLWIMPPGGVFTSLAIPEEFQGVINQNCIAIAGDGNLYGASVYAGSDANGVLWRLNRVGSSYSFEMIHEFTLGDAKPYDYTVIEVGPDGSLYGTSEDGIWRYGLPLAELPPVYALALRPEPVLAGISEMKGVIRAPSGVTSVEFLIGTSPTNLSRVLPISPVPDTTHGEMENVGLRVTGLKPKTIHYFQLRFTSPDGTTTRSSVESFVPPFGADYYSEKDFFVPMTTTDPVANPFGLSVTLSGSFEVRGYSIRNGYFLLGTAPNALLDVHQTTPATFYHETFPSTTEAASATVNGLLPHTRYYYRLADVNANERILGNLQSFMTPNAVPVAADDALDFIPGLPCDLRVLANDSDADGDVLKITAVQGWNTANGKLEIKGGILRVTSVSGYVGGAFTYTVADGFGGTATGTVTLTEGSISLTPSALSFTAAGGTQSVNVTTLASWTVLKPASWLGISPVNGHGSGSIQVSAAASPSTAARSANLIVGSQVVSITQAGQLPPSFGALGPVPTATAGTWYELSIPIVNLPVTYRIVGLPPGLKVNAVTNRIEGFPSLPSAQPYTVTVNASNKAGSTNSAPLTFAIQVNSPAPTLQGAYHGMVAPGPLNTELGGQVQVNITAKGSLTGSLVHGGYTYKLTALVDTTAGSPGDLAIGRYEGIARQKGAPDLLLSLRFHPNGQVDRITGTVSLPNGSQPLAVDGGKLATAMEAAPFTGKMYQVFLHPQSPTSITSPEGYGTLQLTISDNGSIVWKGSLADGTIVAMAGAVRKGGQVPLVAILPRGSWAISGLATLTEDSGSQAAHTVAGTMRWLKKQTSARSYGKGFLLSAVNISGRRHLPPTGGGISLAANPLSPPLNNATLTFTGAGLSLANQRSWHTQQCLIQTAGVPKLTADRVTNPTNVKFLTYDRDRGIFSGTFTLKDHPGSRTVKFSGLLDEVGRIGRGWFLLQQLPIASHQSFTTTPTLSGNITLIPSM
jgi:hypothetical protein